MVDKLVQEFVRVTNTLVRYGGFSVAEAQYRFFSKENITDRGAKRRLCGEYRRKEDQKRRKAQKVQPQQTGTPSLILSRRVILEVHAKSRYDAKTLGDTEIS